MAKIENETEKAPEQHRHTFEVAVSFSGIDQGAVFVQQPDEWTAYYVNAGYLIDRGEEASNVGGREGQG